MNPSPRSPYFAEKSNPQASQTNFLCFCMICLLHDLPFLASHQFGPALPHHVFASQKPPLGGLLHVLTIARLSSRRTRLGIVNACDNGLGDRMDRLPSELTPNVLLRLRAPC